MVRDLGLHSKPTLVRSPTSAIWAEKATAIPFDTLKQGNELRAHIPKT